MKSFYLKTDKFWIFTRIFFTLLFIIAFIKVFFDTDFVTQSIIGFLILGLYISLMIFILIRRAYKNPIPSAVKMTTGIISILIGLLMSYSILTNQNIDELLKIIFHFVPIWIILLGLRDTILYQNNTQLKANNRCHLNKTEYED